MADTESGDRFDYVIVGAGSAGCVLANRLTEDPNITVAVLEAGGHNDKLLVNMPAGASQLFNNATILLVNTAGGANASYLVKKVQGATGIQGGRMPLNSGMLCAEKIDALTAWIESGAPNN